MLTSCIQQECVIQIIDKVTSCRFTIYCSFTCFYIQMNFLHLWFIIIWLSISCIHISCIKPICGNLIRNKSLRILHSNLNWHKYWFLRDTVVQFIFWSIFNVTSICNYCFITIISYFNRFTLIYVISLSE